MFDGNWMLYIFILILLFGRDGEISGTELGVLLASAFAVLMCDNDCGGFFNRCGMNNCGGL